MLETNGPADLGGGSTLTTILRCCGISIRIRRCAPRSGRFGEGLESGASSEYLVEWLYGSATRSSVLRPGKSRHV